MARWKPRDPLKDFQPLLDFLYTPLTEENYRELLAGVCPLVYRDLGLDGEYPAIAFADGDISYGKAAKMAQALRAELDRILGNGKRYSRTPALTWETMLRVPLTKLMLASRDGTGYLTLKRCTECHRPFSELRRRPKATCSSEKCRRAHSRKTAAARQMHRPSTSRV